MQREPERHSPGHPRREPQPPDLEKAPALAALAGMHMLRRMKQKYPPQGQAAQTQAELPVVTAAAPRPPTQPVTGEPGERPQPQGALPGQVYTRMLMPTVPRPAAPAVELGVVQRALDRDEPEPPPDSDQAFERVSPGEERPEPALDLDRVAEQVYPVILRKLAEEKRRFGR